jgi:hypothetical protein
MSQTSKERERQQFSPHNITPRYNRFYLFACVMRGICFAVLTKSEVDSKKLVSTRDVVYVGDLVWLVQPRFLNEKLGDVENDIPVFELSCCMLRELLPAVAVKCTPVAFISHPNNSKYNYFNLK